MASIYYRVTYVPTGERFSTAAPRAVAVRARTETMVENCILIVVGCFETSVFVGRSDWNVCG
jgi:hypothetical protein